MALYTLYLYIAFYLFTFDFTLFTYIKKHLNREDLLPHRKKDIVSENPHVPFIFPQSPRDESITKSIYGHFIH